MISIPSLQSQEIASTNHSHLIREKVLCASMAGFLVKYHFNITWTSTIILNIFLTSVTYLSETYLRKEKKDNIRWLKITNIKQALKDIQKSCLDYLANIISAAFIVNPKQSIALKIMEGDLRCIFIACITAPICEEILFRGFLKERFEDLIYIFEKYSFKTSNCFRSYFPNIAQGLIFGYMHIRGNQILKTASKIEIFVLTSLIGGVLNLVASEQKSLIPSICLHSASNLSFIIALFLKQKALSYYPQLQIFLNKFKQNNLKIPYF